MSVLLILFFPKSSRISSSLSTESDFFGWKRVSILAIRIGWLCSWRRVLKSSNRFFLRINLISSSVSPASFR